MRKTIAPIFLFMLAFLLAFCERAFATDYVTIANGDAKIGTTWLNGNVPKSFGGTGDNETTITINHNVYYKGDYAVPGTLTINANCVLITQKFEVKSGNYLILNGVLICFEVYRDASGNVTGGGTIISGKFTGNAPPTSITSVTGVNIWTGNTSNDWNTSTNWYASGATTPVVPPNGSFAAIGPFPDNQPVIDNTAISLGTIYIAISQSLTINPNASLTVNIANLYSKGILNIKSDANGTGSLLLSNIPVLSNEAQVNVQRYIPSAKWHIVSSPVAGQGLRNFASGNSIGNYPEVTPTEYDLSSYTEFDDTWSFVTISGGIDPGDFATAVGYSTHRTTAGAVTFSGNGIYTGDLTVPITCGAATNGWNCIGNPYTSAINAATFLTENAAAIDNSFEFIYLWDENAAGGTGDYIQVTEGAIALGQGFFVNSVVNGATINFTSAMQITGGTFKSSEIPWPTIKLIAQAEGLSNVATINFNSGMTRGLDSGYDGGKLKGNPNIALYTRLLEDNGIDFAIQALPEITTEALRIPVGIDFVPGGEMSFMVETTAFPVDARVYIEDLQAETTTLLNTDNAKYTVTLPAETTGTGRFNLLVTKSTTGIKAVTENLFNVFASGNTININGPATSDTELSLFSIDGKQWMSRHAENMNQNTIDASDFPAGIYMLNIRHQGNQITKKLVLMK